MEQRLTLLEKATQPLYAPESPLLLEASALYVDNWDKQCIAQLKWKNIGEKAINAVMVELKCFDSFGHEVNTKQYQYNRLSANKGQQFGNKDAIPLEADKLSKCTVFLTAISFADGTVQELPAPMEFKPLPDNKPLDLTGKLLEQYKRDLIKQKITTTVRFQPQSTDSLWQCTCGSWQMNGSVCLACSASKDTLDSVADVTALEQHLEEYEAEQEVLRLAEEQRRQKEEEERRRKEEEEKRLKEIAQREAEARSFAAREKRKRNGIITSVSFIAIAAIACLAIFYLIPKSHYDRAVALMEQEWYEEASEAFVMAGDYSDASSRILEPYYKQGEALMAAGDEDGAIAAFKKAEPFSNAKERWQMIYYAQAERYLATEERTAAFDAFVNAGEYSDASERMKELFQKEIKSYDVWYMNAPLDTVVEVETYVQAKQSWWDNKATIYTQNEEGAYFIYEMAISEEDYNKLVPGTKILVKGFKAEWAGEVEIVDATYEILDGKWIASPKDFTDMLGSEELINYQNQLAAFKGMTVEAIEYKNGEPGDDIYVTLSLNGQKYDFCVERYLTGPETEVYTAVGGLHAGDVVDVEGFMYWYNGINTHITKIYKH